MNYKTILFPLMLAGGAALADGGNQPTETLLTFYAFDGTCDQFQIQTAFNQSLYTFDPDIGAATPTCTGTCAEKWPPYVITSAEVASLPSSDYGTIARANGLLQVTYKGNPLYTFYQDRNQANALGDGLGGVWHRAIYSLQN